MKVALITGVTGQDGAYLSANLLANGYRVIGTMRRSATPHLWRLNEVDVIGHENFVLDTLDITCSASVNRIFDKHKPDEIYNLAAQSFVAESFNSPISTAQINYIGVLNQLEWVRNNPEARFYQASTSEMFGLVDVEAQNEATQFHPRSPYGVAKLAAHWAVKNYRESYNLHASCGILFNHESPLRGEEFVTRKATKAVARISEGLQDKLYLGNMSAMRDWGHAEDYVDGMRLMLQQDLADDYVLATGEAYNIEILCDIAFSVFDLDWHDYVEIDPQFYRPCEVPLLRGDPAKAEHVLGWNRIYTFDHMIEQMVKADRERL